MSGSTSSDGYGGETNVGRHGRLTRGQLLAAGAGVAVVAGAGGVGVFRFFTGSSSREVVLRPRPETVELGPRLVATWTYGNGIPGPELRVRQGERLRVRVENGLPESTTVHWHGIRVPNGMDGVPGMTQKAIGPGETFVYDFVPPDAGTYWFHPHVGTQLDRGLYASLIVEARNETLAHDREAVIVLDDWLDGLGRTPDAVLRRLMVLGMQMPGMGGMSAMKDMSGMGGMDMGGLGSLTGGNLAALGDGSIVVAGSAVTVAGDDPVSGTLAAFVNLLMSGNGDPGDVTYPLFLLNGRPPADPQTFEVRRGDRVRLRLISAAADTHFLFSVDGHPLSLVASDGQLVEPLEVDGRRPRDGGASGCHPPRLDPRRLPSPGHAPGKARARRRHPSLYGCGAVAAAAGHRACEGTATRRVLLGRSRGRSDFTRRRAPGHSSRFTSARQPARS